MVWSASAHDAMVARSGDPMVGLCANFVATENFKPLVHPSKWEAYVRATEMDEQGNAEGVVVESSSQASRSTHTFA